MAVDVGSAVGYLDLDISGFLSSLKKAKEDSDTVTRSMSQTASDVLGSMGKTLTTVGSTLTKSLTVPITGVATAIAKIGMDFEQGMAEVKAISGATADDMQRLTDKAKEMGAATKFSASESAEAFKYMAMAGWDADEMLNSISGVMNLAAASGEDLGRVSDIVTDAMTAFGMAADGTSIVLKNGINVEVPNCTRFVDVLAATSSSANTDVSMLGESFKMCGALAGNMGYSIEDVSIALGIMANAGIKGSAAGEALRTILVNMANPTDTMAQAMDALGLSLEDDNGRMYSLMDILMQLRQGFQGGQLDTEEFNKRLSELAAELDSGKISEKDYEESVMSLTTQMYGAEGAAKAAYAAMLAGKTGLPGLMSIVSATDEDFKTLTDDIYDCSGKSEDMAAIMRDTLKGQFDELKSATEGVALEFYEILSPAISEMVECVQGLVAKLQELTPEQKEQVVKWAAIAAAVGPVTLVLGKVCTALSAVFAVVSKIPQGLGLLKSAFALVCSPIGAVVAAITALVAAFVYLMATNEDFRAKIVAIWERVKGSFEDFFNGIVTRLNDLGFEFENITEVISAVWNGFCELLAPVIEGIFTNIANTIDVTLGVITGLFDVFIGFFKGVFTGDWSQLWDGISGIFTSVWEGIQGFFSNILNVILGIFDTVCGWFGTTWSDTWEGIKQFFADIGETISTAVSDFIDGVVTFFSELPGKIAEFLLSIITNVIEWSADIIDKAIETGSNFLSNIIDFFMQLPGKIQNFILSAWDNVKKWAADMVAKALEMAQNFLARIVSFFSQLPGKVKEFITSTFENVKKWAGDMVDKALEMAKDFLANIVSFFTQLPGKVKEFITSAFENVKTWATDMTKKASDMAKEFLDNVISFFTKLPGDIKTKVTDAYNKVVSWAKDMTDKAKSAGKDFLDNVISFVTQLPGKLKTELDNAISKAASFVTDLGNKAKEAGKGLIDNFKSACGDIASAVSDIGKNIVDGVWNGINAAKDAFLQNVKDFFKGIVDGVKNTLGIKSPSTVFRDAVGKFIPLGVAAGVQQAMPGAISDIQSEFDNMADEITPGSIKPPTIGALEDFAAGIKVVYSGIISYVASAESKVVESVRNIVDAMRVLQDVGTMATPDGFTVGYVGYGGFGMQHDKTPDRPDIPKYSQGGDTFIFNSPKAIDEAQAARLLKRTKQQLAERG